MPHPTRKKIRLQGYDYSQPSEYFVTICTKDREHLFGKIVDGEMQLSEFGKIAKQEWENTPDVRENVELDEYVIMPNHVHGIVVITDVIGIDCVGIDCNQSLRNQSQPEFTGHKYGPQSNNLFAIIRGFKGAATKQVNQKRKNVEGGSIWQSRFYDHIIRDEKSLDRIRTYIIDNPINWQNDIENMYFMPEISVRGRDRRGREHYKGLFVKERL